MANDLTNEIAAVYSMGITELNEKFEELYGFPPGQTNITTIRNRIIYRMQEVNYDGVSLEDRDFLKNLIINDPLAHLIRKPQSRITKTAGARYERVWKGKKYEVIVQGENKFEFNGVSYSSLSAIARTITGTRWNGKTFFGVK